MSSIFHLSGGLGLVFGQLLQDGESPHNGDVLQDVHRAVALLGGTSDVPKGMGIQVPVQGALAVDPPGPCNGSHEDQHHGGASSKDEDVSTLIF